MDNAMSNDQMCFVWVHQIAGYRPMITAQKWSALRLATPQLKILQRHALSADEACLSIDELAARYPFAAADTANKTPLSVRVQESTTKGV
jgi:hypothetical protein